MPCPAWAPPSNRADPARTFPQMKVVVADPLATASKYRKYRYYIVVLSRQSGKLMRKKKDNIYACKTRKER